ncbi:MAG: scavenger receptor cysteine-rich domain-containing protein [Proteobacteria bacterium]|nr:scavenger receptor cysteine-rich domain-containing protein [Pseudomonadota bacterium]
MTTFTIRYVIIEAMMHLWSSLSLLLSLSLITLTSSQSNGDVRLVDGRNSYEGRLEIFLKGKWGTFCGTDNTKFTRGAAEAACKQLGYNDQIEYGSVNHLKFPEASSDTPILIGMADCDYRFALGQLHILRCNISDEVSSSCSQDTAIGVKCEHVSRWIPSQTYNTAVRLSNATEYTSSGVLEIYLNKVWGNVCVLPGSHSAGFDQHAADSACRQLGYTNAAKYRTDSQSSQSTVWLDGITCGGTTSCNCLNRCFQSIPTNPFVLCDDDSFVYIECTFDLSLKDSATSGNILLCGESTGGKCSGPGGGGGGGGGEEGHHISGGALAGIIIGVCLLGCLLVSIVCLTASLFVPNCPLNKWRHKQTYKRLHSYNYN